MNANPVRGRFQIVNRLPGGAWASDYDPQREIVTCGLYALLKDKSKECSYQRKTKCETCPVYNGFMGNERYRHVLQNIKPSV